MKAILIIYYILLFQKMIPGIIIILNNKNEEGCLDYFLSLKYCNDKLIFLDKMKM